MKEKEAKIRERREIEATKKDLMGSPGKIGTIVRFLGSPIDSEDGAFYQVKPMGDPWMLPEDENEPMIQDMDEDATSMSIGWLFDGLSRGMHLEIKYLEQKSELSVTYKGYLVYCEVAGHLDCYAPFPEWETLIDRLYLAASKIKKSYQKRENLESRRGAEAKAQSFVQKLRMRWGI